MSKPRIVAFYLPQYYPTKENDEWWQKGFTEWTNVGRARPLFKGHYQPKVPSDLGYYDLRVPEVREEQAKLAKLAGIEGFCYWHYWFNGRRLLNRVFDEVVDSGSPNFPFCLCWANHSWFRKNWDVTKPDTLLIEQTYPGEEDFKHHFNTLLGAFKDERYIKIDGKPIFGIYRALDIPNLTTMINTWQKLAHENGLPGIYFWGFTFEETQIPVLKNLPLDAIVFDYMLYAQRNHEKSKLRKIIRKIREQLKITNTINYSFYSNFIQKHLFKEKSIYPCIIPNYDHSPRSGSKNIIITNSLPKYFGKLCEFIMSVRREMPKEENFIFIKAWNEWGEGNYMEPDIKFGRGYINELKKALDSIK